MVSRTHGLIDRSWQPSQAGHYQTDQRSQTHSVGDQVWVDVGLEVGPSRRWSAQIGLPDGEPALGTASPSRALVKPVRTSLCSTNKMTGQPSRR